MCVCVRACPSNNVNTIYSSSVEASKKKIISNIIFFTHKRKDFAAIKKNTCFKIKKKKWTKNRYGKRHLIYLLEICLC